MAPWAGGVRDGCCCHRCRVPPGEDVFAQRPPRDPSVLLHPTLCQVWDSQSCLSKPTQETPGKQPLGTGALKLLREVPGALGGPVLVRTMPATWLTPYPRFPFLAISYSQASAQVALSARVLAAASLTQPSMLCVPLTVPHPHVPCHMTAPPFGARMPCHMTALPEVPAYPVTATCGQQHLLACAHTPGHTCPLPHLPPDRVLGLHRPPGLHLLLRARALALREAPAAAAVLPSSR